MFSQFVFYVCCQRRPKHGFWKACLCKRGVSLGRRMLLGSGMIGGAHNAWCYIVVSGLWHTV